MTDTGGMNVQINDTPISQEQAILCVGVWGVYAQVSMSQQPSSQ